MAFEKIVFAMKTWKDKVSGNTPITAAELNRIEKGISDCAKQTNALGDSVSRGDAETDDFDKVVEPGCYIIGGLAQNAANLPDGAQPWGVLAVHAGQPGGYLIQTYADSYGAIWFRTCWATSWYPWVKIGA